MPIALDRETRKRVTFLTCVSCTNLPLLWMLVLASTPLRADTGDVESSHDYAGFPRPPGFVITDYDEDNPAQFDFPVALPLPIDANHIETVRVMGHRYVIRYELSAGKQPPRCFRHNSITKSSPPMAASRSKKAVRSEM